ncbi:aldehyde dehydrogenase family protein [Subtercola endophyticus]|uniref:aldehyde dehydrogenase family protein n=1 Tax=Subtercola endophyticus TaxID=2895559 RepID=UPI001E33F9D4|nr:aldehyde dehydrogenase family protein [Subtercola endophyticus]UFS58325.1 aldehyde dehydrogenase family protein [Subtercola endophyticus]
MTSETAETSLDSQQIKHYPLFIGGQWVDSDERYTIIDPATGELVATAAKGNREHADAAVKAAKESFESGVWKNQSPAQRADVLERFASAWEARIDELSVLTTKESGIPVRLGAVFGVYSPVADTRQFAADLRRFEWERPGPVLEPMLAVGILRREPIGVCLGIVPWNTPTALAIWKAIPALAAGNSVVLKVDEKTPVTGLELAKALSDAGLPDGVFNVVTGEGRDVGSYLTEHKDVSHVSFTGSTATGRTVMAAAAARLKPVVLELGGKGPNIILEDADLDAAVDGSIWAFMMHSGQACESGTRLLLPESIHDEFVSRLIARVKTMRLGDTLDPLTDVGPLVSDHQRKRVLAYIESGKADGARVVIGGGVPEGEQFANGYYVEPTIFVDATNDMKIAREEIFGPVLTVIKYDSLEQAIEIANDTEYGLSAGIWSEDIEKALAVARQIEAGSIWINDFHCATSKYPFGGYKQSGVGRELGSSAMNDYTEEKTILLSVSTQGSRLAKYGLVLGTPRDAS